MPEDAWQALVKRCRKELTFCERVREGEKRETSRFLDQIARAETEQDPLKRVKVAHDLARGSRGPQEKLAFYSARLLCSEPPPACKARDRSRKLGEENTALGQNEDLGHAGAPHRRCPVPFRKT